MVTFMVEVMLQEAGGRGKSVESTVQLAWLCWTLTKSRVIEWGKIWDLK